METIFKSPRLSKKGLLITLVLSMFFSPLLTLSASNKVQPTVNIDDSSLVQTSIKPTITGTATGTKTLWITIYEEGSSKKSYKSNSVSVKKDGVWKKKVSKKLKPGNYEIEITKSKNSDSILASSTLTIEAKEKTNSKSNTKSNSKSTGDLIVGSIPLLSGGTVSPGQTVPLSYLQVINPGKNAVTVKGFQVKQNGSASTNVITELLTIDDKGVPTGSASGSKLFDKGTAFVAANAVIQPGQMKLFTVKAVISNTAVNIPGKNLMIDITGIESDGSSKSKFPIKGTTWMFLK